MTARILVVSGPPLSGKTVVSRVLCTRYSYEYCNIGDLMSARLQRPPDDRRDIGPQFLKQFGIHGYATLLRRHTKDGILFDGLRLRAGLDAIANVAEPVLIFKDGPREDAVVEGQEYDIRWLRTAADVILPWAPEPSQLVNEVASIDLPPGLGLPRR